MVAAITIIDGLQILREKGKESSDLFIKKKMQLNAEKILKINYRMNFHMITRKENIRSVCNDCTVWRKRKR